MTKRHLLLYVLALSLVAAAPAWAGDGANDNNIQPVKVRSADARLQSIYDAVLADKESLLARGELCMIGAIPGPGDGFNIRFGLFNVVGDTVNTAILDSFSALGGASLLHESVFAVTAPQGGVTNVEYPSLAPGKGPVVLSFDGFDLFDSTSFNTDPDTYDDPAFGATVEQMNGTVVEVVYNGDKRCRGVFVFNAGLNASLALIVQVFP